MLFDVFYLEMEDTMGQKKQFVIIGAGGAGTPAAMLTCNTNPDYAVTLIRAEPCTIVR